MTDVAALEQKKEFVPPEDGSWVPKERLDEATGKLKQDLQSQNEALQVEREARIRLEEQVKANDKNIAPEHNRGDLLKRVEEQTMTQAQADEIWERQITLNITKELRSDLDNRESIQSITQVVNADIARYKELVPDVMKSGTEDRGKVMDEYQYLVNHGSQKGINTELAALRAVYGSIEALGKRQKKSQDLETHQETGGNEPPEFKNSKGVLKTLSPREKDYYSGMIGKGVYKDWEHVEKTLAHANSGLRNRMGAR